MQNLSHITTQPPDAIRHSVDRAFVGALAPPQPELETCPKCSTPKPISDFGIASHRADGRNPNCKVCVATRAALKRAAARTRQFEERAAAARRQRTQATNAPLKPPLPPKPPKLSRAEREAQRRARAIYNAIRAGAETRREIHVQTGFSFTRIGDGIAALLTEPAQPLIRLRRDGDTARFFTVRQWPEACA